MSRKFVSVLAVVIAVVVFATACGGDDDDAGSDAAASNDGGIDASSPDDGAGGATGGAGDGGPSSDAAAPSDDGAGTDAGEEPPINGGKPVVEVPDGDPPTELVTIDLVEGDGEEAVDGSTVEVHYVGVAWSTGEEFDSSWDNGQTLPVELGAGRVIQGWELGLLGMREGGRRELRIPFDLAYGEQGRAPIIGPSEDLIFVVDLISVSQPLPIPEVVFPPEVPTELVVEDIAVGEGAAAELTDSVIINFAVGNITTGEVVASTWEQGGPLVFDLGTGRVGTIVGLEQGIVGMQEGGQRRLLVPADLAFDEQAGPIGPDDSLVIVVELLAIR